MSDVEWWEARRYFYFKDDQEVATMPTDSTRGRRKIAKFNIPDFRNRVCTSTSKPSWELLNIFFEELLTENDIPLDENYPGIDRDGNSVQLSYISSFADREHDPAAPWNPLVQSPDRIDESFGEEYPNKKPSLWLILADSIFEIVNPPPPGSVDLKLIEILYIIAGSREQYNWKTASALEYEEIEQRFDQLQKALDFFKSKGEYYQDDDDYLDTRTFQRLEAEYDYCLYLAATNFQRPLLDVRPPIRMPEEGNRIDRTRNYRRDFIFDGTQMYYELYDNLPRPTAIDTMDLAAAKHFLETKWTPIFESWSYVDGIYPDKFLQARGEGVAMELDDGGVKNWLFMTPNEVREGNRDLSGQENVNEQTAILMEAYFELFCTGEFRQWGLVEPVIYLESSTRINFGPVVLIALGGVALYYLTMDS